MLSQLSEETGYPVLQQHGQRLTGPPPDWDGPEPERGSELYCYLIPRDCFEVRNLTSLEIKRGLIYIVVFRTSWCRSSSQLAVSTR